MTIMMPLDNVTLTGTATDDGLPAGSTISYSWEFVSGPTNTAGIPSAVIATPAAAATSVRLTAGPGDYQFNLKASDSDLVGTKTVHVTVNANTDPITSLYPTAIASGVSGWTTSSPEAEGMTTAGLLAAQTYSQNTGVTPRNESGIVIRHGKLVYSWGDLGLGYEMKSTTKSMGGLALFLALDEGKLKLSDKASAHLPTLGTVPSVTPTAPLTNANFADITVLQLATHTAGFSKSDLLANPRTLDYAPGTTWAYSDQGLNWLADTLTQTYTRDLWALMFSRVYTPLGIRGGQTNTAGDIGWRDDTATGRPGTLPDGVTIRRELASGMKANVNAMARVGLLMLRQGAWGNQQLLSNAAVTTAHTPPAEVASATLAPLPNYSNDYPDATVNYGVLWWTNKNHRMANVPTDAYWAWGLHETFIIVIPSLDLVIARAADVAGWHAGAEDWNADYNILAPFLEPITTTTTP